MKTAIIIHGAYGNPNINWFPWLKERLEEQDYQVFSPQFPTPQNQNLTSWLKVAEPYFDQLDTNSVIIGHSIGATFTLRLLEQLNRPIAVAALVAGFITDLPDESLNLINHTFYNHVFNLDKIHSAARDFLLYHSPDDPFVPMERAEQLAEMLRTPLHIVNKAGHFNEAAGYTTFPILLREILSTASKQSPK